MFSRDGSLLPSIYADGRYIDAVIVSKASEEEEFQSHLVALVGWVAARKHSNVFPNPFAAVDADAGEEAHLASWIASQRRMRQKKRMPQQRCDQLIAAFPTWKWSSDAVCAQVGAGAGAGSAAALELDTVLGARCKCDCGKTFNGAQQRDQHRRGKKCRLNAAP